MFNPDFYFYKMAVPLRCYSLVLLAFLVLNINENVNAKITSRHPAEYIHQRIGHGIKRNVLETKQQNCTTILDNYPTECNITLLAGNLTNVVDNAPSTLSPSDYATLNDVYSKLCVAKCVNPIIQYYECFLSGDMLTYFKNLVQRGICGKHDGDFCEVLYLRRYGNNIHYVDQLVDACPFTSSGIYCSSASNTCKGYVTNFTTNMGCCTAAYLGDVSDCNVVANDLCQSAVSGFGAVTPAILSVSLMAILSTIFS